METRVTEMARDKTLNGFITMNLEHNKLSGYRNEEYYFDSMQRSLHYV